MCIIRGNTRASSAFCLFAIPLFALMLASCGGGGGGGDNGDDSQNGSTINATYSKGPVNGATATLHDSDSNTIAGPVTTTNGSASFTNVTFSGPVYASFAGGGYTDEATGSTVTLDATFVIRSGVISNTATGTLEIIATPLTEIAFRRAEAAAGGANLDLSTVNSFIGIVADEFGLELINLTEVAPTPLANITGTSEGDRYGAVLAAITQQQMNASIPPSSTALSNYISNNVTGLDEGAFSAAVNDLVTNVNTSPFITNSIVSAIDNNIGRAPILSSISAMPAATSTVLQFSSDEAGTAYFLAQIGGSTPTAAQVKNGSGNGGTVNGAGSSAAVSGINVVNITGLSEGTTYALYVMVEDAFGNQSIVASTIATTANIPDTTAPILSSITAIPAATSVVLQFSSDEAGTAYFLAQIGGSAPTAAQVKSGSGNGGTVNGAGSSAAVSGINVVNITGLAASTAYTIYLIVEDVSGNQSTISSTSVTTLAPPPITSFELLDPTPGSGDQFGRIVVILSNGNIVVSDRFDSSIASNNGAVHLYSPLTQALIASIYGDVAGDQLGTNITALSNSNYVISSIFDDEGGVVDGGSVRLVDGTTGVQIGSAIAGDTAGDGIGNTITALPNNNYVITSSLDDEGGVIDGGSVRLVDGTTGIQIGSTISGDTTNDGVGTTITALQNNNYVIASYLDNEAGQIFNGSVRLMNGTTGAQIGTTIVGQGNNEIGRVVISLPNDNYVIASAYDDIGGQVNAGSVRLIDGATGVQIGNTIVGDVASDLLGLGTTALSNGNYVIFSGLDNVGGINDAGSVILVNGTTGAQIGNTISGDAAGDSLGSVIPLPNSNYVISSLFDDEGGIVNNGSVRLVDGTTGIQIGDTIAGIAPGDALGEPTISLTNNNYVTVATGHSVGGNYGAGLVMMVNGTTGIQIGTALTGDAGGDALPTSLTALANNNYVISSRLDDEGGVADAGSIRLVNGVTGVQIGSTLAGDTAGDQLGYSRRFICGCNASANDNIGVTALSNSNFVVISEFDSEGGIAFAGSVRLVDGATGAQIGNTISGSTFGDMSEPMVTESTNGDFYILSLSLADNNGMVDSGLVRLFAQ